MEDYKRYISGGLSGIVEVIMTHPLDFLKTKKQEYIQSDIKTNFYKSLLNEKNLNLYRGVIPRLYGVIPMRFTFWGVQDHTNCYLNKNGIHSYKNDVISGCMAGSFQTLIDNPIEILKIQSISNKKVSFKEIIFNNYGFTATLFRNIGFAVCMTTIGTHNKSDNNFNNFCVTAIAGGVASLITQPLDYVKTQLQRTKTKKPIVKILAEIIKENPKKLYVGGLNRGLLGFFSMGIGFVAYDNFYKMICNI